MIPRTMALFTRALQLEARSLRPYFMRGAVLLVLLFALWTMYQFRSSVRLTAPGLRLFTTLVWSNLVVITLVGLSYFTSAIAEEKEEHTLGLLKMADLSPLAILLGKSTSRLVEVGLLLAVQLPFAVLAITLGGVAPAQILAAAAALGAYVLLVNGIALFSSVACRTTIRAGRLTALLLILLYVLPFALGTICNEWLRHVPDAFAGDFVQVVGPACNWLTATSVFVRLAAILSTGFAEPAFGPQVIQDLSLGLVFYLLSWATFDWYTRYEKEAPGPRGMVGNRGGRGGRRRLQPKPIWRWPVAWKDFYFLAGGRWSQLLKVMILSAITAIFMIVVYVAPRSMGVRPNFEFTHLGLVLFWSSFWLFILDLATVAARVFNDEVKSQTLPPLILLPVPLAEMCYKKIAGCLVTSLPYLLGMVVGAACMPELVADVAGDLLVHHEPWIFMVYAGVGFLLFLHLTALLSLYVKRGALALAFGITYFGLTFVLMIFRLIVQLIFDFRGDNEIFGALSMAFMIALTVVLHLQIGRRLIQVAAK